MSLDTDIVTNKIVQEANNLGVPANIALAVAHQESGLNQAAIGSKGELGVFQLMPSTATGLGVNASNLDSNILGGISYLKQLYDRFGDWGKALAAYNAGPTAVVKNRIPTSTQGYVSNILSKAGEFLGIGESESGGSGSSGSLAEFNPLSGYSGEPGGGEGEQGSSNLGMLAGALVVGILGVWMVS